jgi:hypothetical protein
MSLKMFRFSVENMTTRETASFIGQGHGIKEALADAIKGAESTFKPKNDGRSRDNVGVVAVSPGGARKTRSLLDFEGDIAFLDSEEEIGFV